MKTGFRFPEYRYFYELANSRSMRKAADALHIAPSALSRQIKKIEDILGSQVLDRGKSGIRLTAEGELLLQHIKEHFASEDRLLAKIEDIKGLQRGHVRIACGEGFLPDLLGKPLQTFAKKYPGITVNIAVVGSDGIVKLVVEEEAELGIVFCPPADERISAIACCNQPLYAIMSPLHKLAKSNSLSLKDLNGHSLAVHGGSHGVRQIINNVARSEKLHVVPTFTANSTIALKAFAENYGAITILRRYAAMPEISVGTLVAVPLSDKRFRTSEVELIVRRDRERSLAAAELSRNLVANMKAFGASN